ncbi:hypothetical protein DESUT3_40270 [Desulfuromonas versatilis]|uniref:HEAT repeat domain-containing protein n=1 Tax=Desulfuromonas versatilis TaxID=2802975 RepID=A0ABN6E3S0_9BACT|nr:HEAT repeat domain-containing protein [Desulfuromonas versatilis]BCR06958.1 hypothetical protein DESUT3_40270 [Desulfuromonas versatilis]
MRRFLLTSCIVILLLGAFGLTFFTVSPYRVSGQPYLRSLNDFVLLLGSDRPGPFSADGYRKLLGRAGPKTHRHVEDKIRRKLLRWGEPIIPLLITDLETTFDPAKLRFIAGTLGELQAEPGALAMAELLLRLEGDPRDVPGVRRALLTALEKSRAAAAAPQLIAYLGQNPRHRSEVYAALGALGRADFLLDEFHRETDWERRDDLIWPLAQTQAPEAMRTLAPLLLHPDNHLRMRTISALSQSAREAAIDACLEVLGRTRDEYVYSAVMQALLANRFAADNPRVVPFLRQFLNHPGLAWEANYALARIGSAEAIDALASLVGTQDPHAVMNHFEYLGSAAFPLIGKFLASPDPYARRQAIYKLEEMLEPQAIPLLRPLLQDPDYWVKKAAGEAILGLEKLQLFKSFTEYLPERAGRSAWRGFRFEMSWGFRDGFAHGISIFKWLHRLGLVVSLGLGLLLIFNLWRVFEPYRFNLFVQFLLVSGFLGDFLLYDEALGDFGQHYLLATGCHLLLLIGFFCKENKPLPGQLGNRFARLGGANLALLAPLLLWFGTPALTQALRRNLVDFANVWPGLVLLLLGCLLVIEQWALPWNLLRPSARRQRRLSALFSTAILGWIAWPLWLQVWIAVSAGNQDQATFHLLLLLPFAWLLLRHWLTLNPFGRQRSFELPRPPLPDWQLASDGERISLRWQPAARGLLQPLLQLLPVLGAGFAAAALAGFYRGGGPGLILSLLVGLAGAALGGLVSEFFRPRVMLQIEDGYLRCGLPRLGGTLGASRWSRHLYLPDAVRARLERRAAPAGGGLSEAEKGWIERLRLISGQGEPGKLPRQAKLAARARLLWSSQSADLLLMDLQVKNLSPGPFSLAMLDRQSGKLSWKAELDGTPVELMFHRRQREQLIPAGAVKSLQLRLFPRGDLAVGPGPEKLTLTGPAGIALELPLPARAGEVAR